MSILTVEKAVVQFLTGEKNEYYKIVQGAQFSFSCISNQRLYLGDLLQLWKNPIWNHLFLESLDHQNKNILQNSSFYIYSTKFNSKTFITQINIWLADKKITHTVYIKDILPLYLSFIRLERPKHKNT